MSSIFSKIIQGEIPSYCVAEDEHNYAFLDINPLSAGHTLCVPKQEVDYLFDLDEGAYDSLMNFSRKVAKALDQSVSCERVGLAVIGLEVPHAHIHLVPINGVYDLDFSKERVQMEPEAFQALADRIRSNF